VTELPVVVDVCPPTDQDHDVAAVPAQDAVMLTAPPDGGKETEVGEIVQLVGAPVPVPPPPPPVVVVVVQLKILLTIDQPPVHVDRSCWMVSAVATDVPAPNSRAHVAEATAELRMCLGERRITNSPWVVADLATRIAQDPIQNYGNGISLVGTGSVRALLSLVNPMFCKQKC
jgi:hypothetical protein